MKLIFQGTLCCINHTSVTKHSSTFTEQSEQ